MPPAPARADRVPTAPIRPLPYGKRRRHPRIIGPQVAQRQRWPVGSGHLKRLPIGEDGCPFAFVSPGVLLKVRLRSEAEPAEDV
ncbi:hypothetical protein SLA_0837 [Streptomyces laurentii]|uniref:Uncharacterized protein n=1 Tax=Streptomyces laurentii TaxID=39478 RepID=A0A160NVU0_STRLU|nr:hypothetical protein SLA_0837 [Streptomyces laurentii]